MSVVVKQYGEMRTGTNYSAFLIERNCDVKVFGPNELGCKHDAPDFDALRQWERDHSDDRMALSITVKEPYAWMASYFQHSWITKPSRDEPRFPWYDLNWRTEEYSRLLLQAFNEKHRIWFDLYDHQEVQGFKVQISRFEDLLFRPKYTFEVLFKKLELPRIAEEFIDETREIGSDEKILTMTPFDKIRYYKQRVYLDRLPHRAWMYVTKYVDWEILSRFGYYPLFECRNADSDQTSTDI